MRITATSGTPTVAYLVFNSRRLGAAYASGDPTGSVRSRLSADGEYFVMMRTRNLSAATLNVRVDLVVARAVCGNSRRDAGELCDDGNATAGDGCSATCQTETGYTCTGTGPASCARTSGWVEDSAETADVRALRSLFRTGTFEDTLRMSADGRTALVRGAVSNCAGCRPYELAFVSVFRKVASVWALEQTISLDSDDSDSNDSVQLSADGSTFAFAVWRQVQVYRRTGNVWASEANLSASNSEEFDGFGSTGSSVSVSADGSTIAVGARGEDGWDTGINGDQGNGAEASGAVYVFRRVGGAWAQEAYVKASNTHEYDRFGSSVALSGDGSTLAVGAPSENSSTTGINSTPNVVGFTNVAGFNSGAVYVFRRSSSDWDQEAYVKANVSTRNFGDSLKLSPDGGRLAVYGQAADEKSAAVHTFGRAATTWTQDGSLQSLLSDAVERARVTKIILKDMMMSDDGALVAFRVIYEKGIYLDVASLVAGRRSRSGWGVESFPENWKYSDSLFLARDGSTVTRERAGSVFVARYYP